MGLNIQLKMLFQNIVALAALLPLIQAEETVLGVYVFHRVRFFSHIMLSHFDWLLEFVQVGLSRVLPSIDLSVLQLG